VDKEAFPDANGRSDRRGLFINRARSSTFT
jgi:hypothetical protein